MSAFAELRRLANDPQYRADRFKKMIAACHEAAVAFNEPKKYVVAINCAHIGDDNDYSCVLSDAVEKLYIVGEKELAHRMILTDTMIVREYYEDFATFCNTMDEQLAAKKKNSASYEAWTR